ncbi:glycoside hydrolase family 25 protein [uncultured Pontibacter sp.]|uniref:glycoside hydrolase family 25 protein n=1 Tax=uncultured Pontibacter sp. TaxID=453356 RepID=UPI00260A8469|nr:glycoside hydrolase family 25 protein [uncultured Pontibacter sp.]
MGKQVDMWPEEQASKSDRVALASIKNIKKPGVKYKEPAKRTPYPKKTGKPSKPRGKKKKTKSARPFWIGVAFLVAIAMGVLYVEFLREEEQPIWPEGHSPMGNSVLGVDVSRYQRKINWEKVKENDVSFAFIKATEGVKLQDSFFERNWEKTAEAGILRGAYHFYLPHLKPDVQAKNFINTVTLAPGDLPPVLDVEVRGRMPLNHFRGDLKEWLVLVERKYGVKPIIYTGHSFYKDYLEGYFDEYPLWIAHYNVRELTLQKTDRTLLSFWQHTDKGVIEGIKGHVDCNIFYGSLRELKTLCIQPPVAKK